MDNGGRYDARTMAANPSSAPRWGAHGGRADAVPWLPRVARAAAALVGALLPLSVGAVSAVGTDGTARIPGEPGVTTLQVLSYGALTADVDGDGRRELVSIEVARDDPTELAVGIWYPGADGYWSEAGQATLRRAVGPAERISRAPFLDADGMTALLSSDPARLIAWQGGGRESALVVVNASRGFGGALPCCVTVWRIEASGVAGGAPELTRVADTDLAGDAIFSADLDGDAVDELVVRDTLDQEGAPRGVSLAVLGWTGVTFTLRTSVTVETGDPRTTSTFVLGDSDGVPGVEIGLVAPSSDGTGWDLHRVGLRGAEAGVETTRMDGPGMALAVPLGFGDGSPAIVYGDDARPVDLFRWPAGGTATPVDLDPMPRIGRPVALLGDARNPWVVLRRLTEDSSTIETVRSNLESGSASGVPASPAATWLLAAHASWPPFQGRWPGARGSQDGYVFGGILLQPTASGDLDRTPVASLADAALVGRLGFGDSWMAVVHGASGPPPDAASVDPRGGSLEETDGSSLAVSIVPVSDLTTAEVAGGLLRPTPVNGVSEQAASDATGLVVGRRGFEVSVEAPDGSLTLSVEDLPGRGFVPVPRPNAMTSLGGPSITGVRSLVGPAFRIPLQIPIRSEPGTTHEFWLFVVTPAGHTYTARLNVRLLISRPALETSTEMLSVGLSATITGRTAPGTQVVVDGSPASVAPDGSFRATVPAGLVPRDVRVVATDGVGNQASETVSVVGPVDYRRLPWIPIAIALTLAVGAFFFLQAPSPRVDQLGESPAESVFEEIDQD